MDQLWNMVLLQVIRHRKIDWKGPLPVRVPVFRWIPKRYITIPSRYYVAKVVKYSGLFHRLTFTVDVATLGLSSKRMRNVVIHELTHAAEFALTGITAHGKSNGSYYQYRQHHCEHLAYGVAAYLTPRVRERLWTDMGL
jgi:hypothetical protein